MKLNELISKSVELFLEYLVVFVSPFVSMRAPEEKISIEGHCLLH